MSVQLDLARAELLSERLQVSEGKEVLIILRYGFKLRTVIFSFVAIGVLLLIILILIDFHIFSTILLVILGLKIRLLSFDLCELLRYGLYRIWVFNIYIGSWIGWLLFFEQFLTIVTAWVGRLGGARGIHGILTLTLILNCIFQQLLALFYEVAGAQLLSPALGLGHCVNALANFIYLLLLPFHVAIESYPEKHIKTHVLPEGLTNFSGVLVELLLQPGDHELGLLLLFGPSEYYTLVYFCL